MLRLVAFIILGFLNSINNGQIEESRTTSIASTDNGATFDSTSTAIVSSSSESIGNGLVNVHEKRAGAHGKEVVTVIVIGSGMAGITAARQLADRTDFDVIVLEANPDRFGGRIWSYEAPGYAGTVES